MWHCHSIWIPVWDHIKATSTFWSQWLYVNFQQDCSLYWLIDTCYRPQTKFAKVMFSQVSVCPLVPGVYGRHPRGPEANTPYPSPLGRHLPAQCMLGYTRNPSLPSACWDTPPPSACWDTHPPAQCMLGYTPTQCMLGYGQQAGGMHPTGMHSCYLIILAQTLSFSCSFRQKSSWVMGLRPELRGWRPSSG